jgi:hypothetical protein
VHSGIAQSIARVRPLLAAQPSSRKKSLIFRAGGES